MNGLPYSGEDVSVLLGAGRSGTTLLYKILSMHRSVAYISNYVQKLPMLPALAVGNRLLHRLPAAKRRAWFMEEGGAYSNGKRVRAHALMPTPFEGETLYSHCGVPLIPASDALPTRDSTIKLRKAFSIMRRCAGGATIMTKRTANNRRVAWLNAAFPAARYINLVRDGRAVAYSLLKVNWWDDHTLFWSGLTPRSMVERGDDPLELAARNWVEEVRMLDMGIAMLNKQQVLEMRYEELLADPITQVERALDFIGVSPGSDPAFRDLLTSLKLEPKRESWPTRWNEAEYRRVVRVQAPTLVRWGYKV